MESHEFVVFCALNCDLIGSETMKPSARDDILNRLKAKIDMLSGYRPVLCKFTGDGYYVAFPVNRFVELTEYAYQLSEYSRSNASGAFRFGLSMGVCKLISSGKDFVGRLPTKLARITSAANPHEVVMCPQFAEALREAPRWQNCIGEEDERITPKRIVKVHALNSLAVGQERDQFIVGARPVSRKGGSGVLLTVGSAFFGALIMLTALNSAQQSRLVGARDLDREEASLVTPAYDTAWRSSDSDPSENGELIRNGGFERVLLDQSQQPIFPGPRRTISTDPSDRNFRESILALPDWFIENKEGGLPDAGVQQPIWHVNQAASLNIWDSRLFQPANLVFASGRTYHLRASIGADMASDDELRFGSLELIAAQPDANGFVKVESFQVIQSSEVSTKWTPGVTELKNKAFVEVEIVHTCSENHAHIGKTVIAAFKLGRPSHGSLLVDNMSLLVDGSLTH